MKKNQIKIQLQTRIRNYFDYTWQEEMEQNDEEIKHLMGKLSNQLQEELKYELRVRVLKSNPSLAKFSEQTLKEISYIMEEVKFSPNETIIQQDQQDDSALYLIEKGKIIILFKDQRDASQNSNNNREFGYLQKGESFGEYSFFTGMKRTATAISKEFSRIFKIKRQSLLPIIAQNSLDKQIFSQIKEGMLFNSEFKSVQIKCYSCQQTTHMINECPLVHYAVCKERVLKQHLYPIPQQRKEFNRKSSTYDHFSARIEMKFLQITIRDLIQNQKNYLEQQGEESPLEVIYDDSSENLTKEITQNHVSGSESYNNFNPVEANRSQLPDYIEYNKNMDDQLLTQSYQRKIQAHPSYKTTGYNAKKNDENSKDNHDEQMYKTNFLFQLSNSKQNRRSQIDVEYQITTPKQPPSLIIDSQDRHYQRGRTYSQKKSIKLEASQESMDSRHNIKIPRKEVTYTKSIRTLRTRQSVLATKYDNLEYPPKINSVENFDKAQNFMKYFPLNNLDIVVKKANWFFKHHFNKKNNSITSLYSFNYLAIRKAHRMRMRKGTNPQKDEQSISGKGKFSVLKSLKRELKVSGFALLNKSNKSIQKINQ